MTPAVDPRELAADLPRIRRHIRRHYAARYPARILDDLVGETALELLERARRRPGARFPPSTLLKFAAGDAVRRVRRSEGFAPGRHFASLEDLAARLAIVAGTPGQPAGLTLAELAVPDHLVELEDLRARISAEATEDQVEEWRALSPRERASRVLEACRGTGTTPPA